MEENKTQTTISDDIKNFNYKLEGLIEKLHNWKSEIVTLQDDFIQKLSAKTTGLKIK